LILNPSLSISNSEREFFFIKSTMLLMSLNSTVDENVTFYRETSATAPHAQQPLTARRLVTGPKVVKVDSPRPSAFPA
jgi:hypothetical protein